MSSKSQSENSKSSTTLLIGLGKGGAALFPYLVASPQFELIGVCDTSSEAIGVPMARLSNIPVFDDPSEAIKSLNPNLVVDATGDPSLPSTLHRVRTASTAVVTADASRLLWELLAALEGRRRSDMRYDRLLNDMNSGVVVLQQNTIRYVNPAFLSIINTEADHVLGKPYCDFVDKEFRERDSNYHEQGLSGETISEEYDTRIMASDGQLHEVSVRLRLSDWDGRAALLLILSDVTRLRDLEREKERFFRFMVHELRAPLSPMVMALATLKEESVQEDKEKYQLLMGIMDRSANRLTSFIDDFLDLSKLNKESLSVTQEPLSLKDILGDVVENQKILADEKGLDFSIDDAGCVDVHGDPVVIRTLCQNLLNNAIKYTNDGSVKIRVLSDADTFTFEVEDTGPGLTDEEQKNLFQEYGRIRRTKGVKGTGLGLALVKKLVDACNGSVAVHSDGKDKGSIFSFTLPRVFGDKKTP